MKVLERSFILAGFSKVRSLSLMQCFVAFYAVEPGVVALSSQCCAIGSPTILKF
jgi:hypothetical protein